MARTYEVVRATDEVEQLATGRRCHSTFSLTLFVSLCPLPQKHPGLAWAPNFAIANLIPITSNKVNYGLMYKRRFPCSKPKLYLTSIAFVKETSVGICVAVWLTRSIHGFADSDVRRKVLEGNFEGVSYLPKRRKGRRSSPDLAQSTRPPMLPLPPQAVQSTMMEIE